MCQGCCTRGKPGCAATRVGRDGAFIPSQGDAAPSAHEHQHPPEHSLLWGREPKAAPGQQPGTGTRGAGQAQPSPSGAELGAAPGLLRTTEPALPWGMLRVIKINKGVDVICSSVSCSICQVNLLSGADPVVPPLLLSPCKRGQASH